MVHICWSRNISDANGVIPLLKGALQCKENGGEFGFLFNKNSCSLLLDVVIAKWKLYCYDEIYQINFAKFTSMCNL